jgi:UDP-N-acetylmuramoyl-tripeptide--D-alanyl-D-alanine ligase
MADALWTVAEISRATQARTVLAPDLSVGGISIDSRSLKLGEAFVAIRGDSRDGHDFVPAALAAGAACALVAKAYAGGEETRLIRVHDPFQALQDLGRAARARTGIAKVIAVTGSAGKTGTKEALRLALAPSGSVHASAKSYNNHWGVPLSLANMGSDTAFGVFEAGMNHAGELTPLSLMIRPHIAVVTTVAPVHLGHFGSVEQIADAKGEIFAGIAPGGTAILNRDNPFFNRLAKAAAKHGARVVSFGEAKDADIRLLDAALDVSGSTVTAEMFGRRIAYSLGAPGRHLVQNSLAVLAAVEAAGADLEAGAAALAGWQAQSGRGEWRVFATKDGKTAIVDEAYNANPASMRAALATLGLTPRSDYCRRVAVLGDMLELGEDAAAFHRALADSVDAAGVDLVFACGELMAALYAALPPEKRGAYAKTAAELTPLLTEAVQTGDVVMVKGSYGTRLGPLVEALQRHLAGGGLR